MTEDEEFEDLERRLKAKETQDNCQHRWEETEFGKKYWEPGTYQFTCHRCGAMNMFRMEPV